MKIGACKDCPDRHFKCHSTCEKYRESVDADRKITENLKKLKEPYNLACEKKNKRERELYKGSYKYNEIYHK